MKRILYTMLFAVSLVVGSVLNVSAESVSNPTASKIDGKTFVGHVGSKGDKKGDADNFEFANGTFHSTACDQFGYTGASYSSASTKGATTFSSVTKNDSGDTITWTGTIKGDTISGTAVRKSGDETSDMWFNGKLKR